MNKIELAAASDVASTTVEIPMLANQSNPYYASATPVAPSAELASANMRLDYGRSITYVFDSPDWIINVFAVVCCTIVGSMIPIVPMMVLVGYQFEIIERLARNPHDRYPTFQFDQIVHYLTRGLYPMLVALLASLVCVPLVLLVMAGPILAMVLLISMLGEDRGVWIAVFMIPLIVFFALVVGVLAHMVILPMVLRAGLMRDVAPAFDLTFIRDFVRRMWKDAMKAGLFWVAAAIIAQVIGGLLFCVGTFFTMAVVQLAQAHLGMQLYRIYVARGGQKIEHVGAALWDAKSSPSMP